MNRRNKKNRGFSLLISVVITGAVIVISTGIVSLASQFIRISTAGRDSQIAFYAADSGIECALFWDIKSPIGRSAFSTDVQNSIYCNKDESNTSNQWTVGGSRISTINKITFLPDPFCAIVTVTKNENGTTLIESRGYNTCDLANPRRVERALRASY